MKSQNTLLHGSSFGTLQQQQGSQIKESTNSNNQVDQSMTNLKQSLQSSDNFPYDSQRILTFQSRAHQQSQDQQKSQNTKHLRNVSQPIQQVNPPLSSVDSSFVHQELSMEEQQFINNSLQRTNRSLDQKSVTEQSIGNISPLLRGEKLFKDYMQDLNTYKETYSQYNQLNKSVNNGSLTSSQIQRRELIEQQQKQIDMLQQQQINKSQERLNSAKDTQQQQQQQQQPLRFPKILFAHSRDFNKSPQQRPRTLTPPVRSPSQSNTAQKPNLSLLTQKTDQSIKVNSFTADESKNHSQHNQSPEDPIAKISTSIVTNTPFSNNPTPPNGTSPSGVNSAQIPKPVLQNNNSQSMQSATKSQNQIESVSNLTKMVNSVTSSSVQKIINKTQNVCGEQKPDLDISAMSSNYQTNKTNINNNNSVSNYATNQPGQAENCNNSFYVSHSNNGKIINIKPTQSQQKQNPNKSFNEYNYSNKQQTTSGEHKNDSTKNSNMFTTPLKQSTSQTKQGGAGGFSYNSHSKTSPIQQVLQSAISTTTGGHGSQKQNMNGSYLQTTDQTSKLESYAKQTDISFTQGEYYKQKIEELMNQIKQKDNYIKEFDSIKNEFFNLKKKLEEKDVDVASHKQQLSQQKSIFLELEVEYNKVVNVNDIQKKQIDEQQEIIAQFRKQVNNTSNESISFNIENQNNFHIAEVNNLKQSILNKEEILQTLRDKTNQSKIQIDDLQSELENLKQENDSLNKQLKSSIQENNELQLMIEDLTTKQTTYQNELREQQKKQQNLQSFDQIIQQQKGDIVSLKSQIDEKSKQLSHTLTELQHLLQENTILTEKYNEVTSQLISKNSELNHIEQTHKRELQQLHSQIKNECAKEIMNEMENLTKPLLSENRYLQEELTKEKQKVEMLIKEKGQMQTYEMLLKLNEHKDNAQQIQNAIDQKINSFIMGQDDVTKQLIEQLRHENRELRRNCDIWKAKYKKIQREMHEVNDQFEEYSKVMTTMKQLQSKMHDMTNSLYSSQVVNQTPQQNTQKREKPSQNNSFNNNSNNIQWSPRTQQQLQQQQLEHYHNQQRNNSLSNSFTPGDEGRGLMNEKMSRHSPRYLDHEAHNLEPDAANSLLDTLEGYDLFEQQLKEEIIQDINRIQNSFNSVQSLQNKSNQQSSIATTSIPSESKHTNRSLDICISSSNNLNNQNSSIKISHNQPNTSSSPSPHFQSNPSLTISVEKNSNQNNSFQLNGKPPQYNRDLAVNKSTPAQMQSGSQQITNQSNKKPPTHSYNNNYNTPSVKNLGKDADMNDFEENTGTGSNQNRQRSLNPQINGNNYPLNQSEQNSPERFRSYQESSYYSQEANASPYQDGTMGVSNQNNQNYNQHSYSNQANCSTSTQQMSPERQHKRIKSLENKELRLICQTDDEDQEEDNQERNKSPILQIQNLKQQTQQPQIQSYSHNNKFIEEERDQDVDYSQSSMTNQSDRNAAEHNGSNQSSKKPSTQQQLIKNLNFSYKVGCGPAGQGNKQKRNTDEFSFKNPSFTENEELNDQLIGEISASVYQKDEQQKMQRTSQQTGFDSDNQANQKCESMNHIKNSCVSSLNNMVCIESIQLDQDNAEILKQMRDLDKKIEKEKTTYEMYLQKCQNLSYDIEHEKSIDSTYPHQQSTDHNRSNQKTGDELTSMLSAFDAQFDNLQKEKLKILNNLKNKDVQRKTPTPPRNHNQKQQRLENNFVDINNNNHRDEHNTFQQKGQQPSIPTPPPPPNSSNQKKYVFNKNEDASDSTVNSENVSEIDELRKRYQQTVQNLLGSERGGVLLKSKLSSMSGGSANQSSLNTSSIPNKISSAEQNQFQTQYSKN